MRKVFSILARIFAVLFAILYVVTAVAALVLFNLERKVFNAQTYKQALANQNFYERMPVIIAQAIASSQSLDPCENNLIACGAEERMPDANACFKDALGADTYQELVSNRRNPTEDELQRAAACLEEYGLDPSTPGEGGPPDYISKLSPSDWEFIISSLLPPDELKSITDQGIDSILAFVNGKTDTATLSLVPLKTRLGSESGVDVVLKMMKAQPECSDAQLIEMGLSMMGQGSLQICNPPPEVVAVLKPMIQVQLESVVSDIPDQATLIPTPASLEDDPRGPLMGLRLAMRLSPLIPLIFLLGVTMMVVRSLKEWLNWWGIPSFIAGLLAGLAGLIGASTTGLLAQNMILRGMPAGMPAIVAESASDLVTAIIKQMIKPVIWQGFLLALIGMAMIVFAYFYGGNKDLRAVKRSEAETIV